MIPCCEHCRGSFGVAPADPTRCTVGARYGHHLHCPVCVRVVGIGVRFPPPPSPPADEPDYEAMRDEREPPRGWEP
jgi:hypothetical protein